MPHWLFERVHGLRQREQSWLSVANRTVSVAWLLAICEALRVSIEILGYVWTWIRWFAIVTGLLLLLVTPVYAVEATCAANPSVCLCSAQLQMTGFTRFSDYLKPNDGSTCSTEGVSPGYAILRTSDDLIGSSDATIMAALPLGNTVTRVLKGPEGHNGGWNIGHLFSSAPNARVSTRWYLYYSSNFVWTGDQSPGSCLNSEKWMVGSTNFPNNPQSGVHDRGAAGAAWHWYAWVGWTPQLDCCPNGGPGNDPTSYPRSALSGKWWRFEMVVRNRSGPGMNFEVYLKNVTNNGPEYKILDTKIPCVGCGNDPANDWSVASGATTTLTPPMPYQETRTEHFRNGPCPGFYAVSHYTSWAWPTDNNQRIGAATEIEGSVAPPVLFTGIGRRLQGFITAALLIIMIYMKLWTINA